MFTKAVREKQLVRWRGTSVFFSLAALVVLGGCAGEEQAPRSVLAVCADGGNLDDALGGQQIEDAFPEADEIARMSEKKKRYWIETVEDFPRFPVLFTLICELSVANALPGVESNLTGKNEKFSFARARREKRLHLLEGIEPATAERACDRLWFMVLEQKGRGRVQYFFCDADKDFTLISAWEDRDEVWVKLE